MIIPLFAICIAFKILFFCRSLLSFSGFSLWGGASYMMSDVWPLNQGSSSVTCLVTCRRYRAQGASSYFIALKCWYSPFVRPYFDFVRFLHYRENGRHSAFPTSRNLKIVGFFLFIYHFVYAAPIYFWAPFGGGWVGFGAGGVPYIWRIYRYKRRNGRASQDVSIGAFPAHVGYPIVSIICQITTLIVFWCDISSRVPLRFLSCGLRRTC